MEHGSSAWELPWATPAHLMNPRSDTQCAWHYRRHSARHWNQMEHCLAIQMEHCSALTRHELGAAEGIALGSALLGAHLEMRLAS